MPQGGGALVPTILLDETHAWTPSRVAQRRLGRRSAAAASAVRLGAGGDGSEVDGIPASRPMLLTRGELLRTALAGVVVSVGASDKAVAAGGIGSLPERGPAMFGA